jgi:hypothetical protein
VFLQGTVFSHRRPSSLSCGILCLLVEPCASQASLLCAVLDVGTVRSHSMWDPVLCSAGHRAKKKSLIYAHVPGNTNPRIRETMGLVLYAGQNISLRGTCKDCALVILTSNPYLSDSHSNEYKLRFPGVHILYMFQYLRQPCCDTAHSYVLRFA